MDRCRDACCALLVTFPDTASCSKVLFSNGYASYLSTCERNTVFWAKENPHFTVEHNSPHVTLWGGMTATRLIGPCLFNGRVNAASYTEMLECG
jgi:hypothetical protein